MPCCGDGFENLRKKVNRLELLVFLIISYLLFQHYIQTDQAHVENLTHHNQLTDDGSSSLMRSHQSKTGDQNERIESVVVFDESGKSNKEQKPVSPTEMKSTQEPLNVHTRRYTVPSSPHWRTHLHEKYKALFESYSSNQSLVPSYPQLSHIDNVSSRKLQAQDTNTSGGDVIASDPSLSICPLSQKETFLFHMKRDLHGSGASWQLLDLTNSSNTISLTPLSDDSSNSTSSYVACLTPGMYRFSIFHNISQEISCENADNCYQIAINDVSIVEKVNFAEISDHDIMISENGEGFELQCLKKPILSPSNPAEENVNDVEIARKFDVLESLSSTLLLQDTKSPQYRAACLLLYDDKVVSSDEVNYLIERYALTLFLYATQQEDEILRLFGRNTCDVIQCNSKGYISVIDYGECDGMTS